MFSSKVLHHSTNYFENYLHHAMHAWHARSLSRLSNYKHLKISKMHDVFRSAMPFMQGEVCNCRYSNHLLRNMKRHVRFVVVRG